MRILITGARGFIGRNLTAELRNRGYEELLEYDVDSPRELLMEYVRMCDFVFHLAGVNRPQTEAEFMSGNAGLTGELVEALQRAGKRVPVVMTSSVQAEQDNPYGASKLAAEELLAQYGGRTVIYRLPNVFGKWCRPNYNSVVATYCYNIARGLPITVNDPMTDMRLVYIDDVVAAFLANLAGGDGNMVEPVYKVKLGRIAELIESFRVSRQTLSVADMGDDFTRKLYSTYLSYLPEEAFAYPLTMNRDERGSFTEFLRTADRGQVSVNVILPGVTKGNHWHHSKNEKFLTVSGGGIVRFRRIDGDEIVEYAVSGEQMEVIDIPPGYTHSIENTGASAMVTVIWVSEAYERSHPDTFYENVL